MRRDGNLCYGIIRRLRRLNADWERVDGGGEYRGVMESVYSGWFGY